MYGKPPSKPYRAARDMHPFKVLELALVAFGVGYRVPVTTGRMRTLGWRTTGRASRWPWTS